MMKSSSLTCLDHEDWTAILVKVWRNLWQQHRPPAVDKGHELAVCAAQVQLSAPMHLQQSSCQTFGLTPKTAVHEGQALLLVA